MLSPKLPRTWKQTCSFMVESMLELGIRPIPAFPEKRLPTSLEDFHDLFRSALMNAHIRRSRANQIASRCLATFALSPLEAEFFKLVRGCQVDEICRLALEHPELAKAEDDCGRQALALASKYGNQYLIETCLAIGCDVNHADALGCTPLHWAIDRKSTFALEALLNAGADCTQINYNGVMPLGRAVYFKNWRAARLIVDLGHPPNRICLDHDIENSTDRHEDWGWIRLTGHGAAGCHRGITSAASGDLQAAFKRQRLSHKEFEAHKEHMPIVRRPRLTLPAVELEGYIGRTTPLFEELIPRGVRI